MITKEEISDLMKNKGLRFFHLLDNANNVIYIQDDVNATVDESIAIITELFDKFKNYRKVTFKGTDSPTKIQQKKFDVRWLVDISDGSTSPLIRDSLGSIASIPSGYVQKEVMEEKINNLILQHKINELSKKVDEKQSEKYLMPEKYYPLVIEGLGKLFGITISPTIQANLSGIKEENATTDELEAEQLMEKLSKVVPLSKINILLKALIAKPELAETAISLIQ